MDIPCKTPVIVFIILLICSVTPAFAVENGEINSTSEDVNAAWAEGVKDALMAISEQETTELTPEQEEYIETHQDAIKARGEGVINNIQEYTNQVEQELNKSKTPIPIKFQNSLKKITQFLKNKNIAADNATYSYDKLLKSVNDTNQSTALNCSRVIIQMKDGIDDYVVYAELLNINESTISVRTSKKANETWGVEEFKTHHTLDENINIIIVPENTNRTYILDLIFQHQKDDLNTRINWCVAGLGVCTAVLGTYGFALISTAMLTCCQNRPRQPVMNLVVQQFEEQGEATYLNPKGRYRGYVEAVDNQPTPQRYKKPFKILGIGVTIVIITVPIIIETYNLKSEYETEKTNLDKWN